MRGYPFALHVCVLAFGEIADATVEYMLSLVFCLFGRDAYLRALFRGTPPAFGGVHISL